MFKTGATRSANIRSSLNHPVIDVRGDEAIVESNWIMMKASSAGMAVTGTGRMRDRFAKHGSRWRIKQRSTMSKYSTWPPILRRRALDDPSTVRLSSLSLVIAIVVIEKAVD